ncbi:hypothetical protein [Okeania sp.]|uniref:hypothetical protein n=1 Tax=Okeania sp. TaxID=3100323 RepID=UPI002B4B073F|nr:hypothetical protein [Okeania sp.]MEB3340555.1 hypothetical protein [Okeania sp.]
METYAYNQTAVIWEKSNNIEQPDCSPCDHIMELLDFGWKMMFTPEWLEIANSVQTD